MPKLYLNLIEATDGMITIGTPVGMVFQGTAAEVVNLCEAIRKEMEKRGFKDGDQL